MNDVSMRAQARQQFEEARRRARLDQVSARLTGRDTRMVPFDLVRRQLRQQSALYRGVEQIPLNQIVGSVGRYTELTRHFLPLSDDMRERWMRVTSLAMNQQGWPPIDLVKVSNVYFVKDGNHRVSAAQQLGFTTIEAHVWEYPETVQIEPENNLDEILIRFGEQAFMETTGLDQMFSDHGIRFTTAGRYTELRAQIADLQQKLAIIDERDVPYAEAVAAWYEMIYLPTVQIIRDSNLLDAFPGRTAADLFVWMSLMRQPLQEAYGDFDNLADLAHLLAAKYREGSLGKLTRQVKRLLGSNTLPPLEEEVAAPTKTESS